MKAATKEMIRLTLTNDDSVSSEVFEAISSILFGNLPEPSECQSEPLLLSMTESARLLGVCRVTFWRMVKDGVFEPVEITPNVFWYRRRDIETFAKQTGKYKPKQRGILSSCNRPRAVA